jgi:hypothetical protein
MTMQKLYDAGKFRIVLFYLFISVTASAFIYAGNILFDSSISFITSLTAISVAGIIGILIVPNRWTPLVIYLTISILTLYVNDLGLVGLAKSSVITASGIIFAAVYTILNYGGVRKTLRFYISSAMSISSLPFISAIVISPSSVKNLPVELVNLGLLGVLSAIIGLGISFVLWYYARNTKLVIKLQASLFPL